MRLAVYYAALGIAFFLPILVFFGFTSYGPQPYVLAAPVGGEWAAPREFPDGSRVTVIDAEEPRRALARTSDVLDTVPIAESGRLFGITRYRTDVTSTFGLVMPLDRYVIHIEAPDEETREARLGALGFVAENPQRNLLHVALTDHVDWVAPGLFAYCILWCFFMARGGAWALRREAPPGTRPASAEELKRSLLALDNMGEPFSVRQIGPDRLRVDLRVADLDWIKAMNETGMRRAARIDLDLDEKTRTVRAVETTHRIKWGEGLIPFSGRFAFFRSVTMARRDDGAAGGVEFDRSRGWRRRDGHRPRFTPGEMKAPLAEAVLDSGWTWQPVFAFVRPLAG